MVRQGGIGASTRRIIRIPHQVVVPHLARGGHAPPDLTARAAKKDNPLPGLIGILPAPIEKSSIIIDFYVKRFYHVLIYRNPWRIIIRQKNGS